MAFNTLSDFVTDTTTNGDQTTPSIVPLSDGRFVVTWASLDNGTDTDIRGRIFNANGTPATVNGSTNDFLVSTTNANTQQRPSVTALDNGGFFVTWSSSNGTDFDVRGALFNADGTRAAINGSTNDVLINTTTANDQITPDITKLTNGEFVVAWASLQVPANPSTVAQYEIFGRIFAADGSPVAVNGSTNDFVMDTPTLNIPSRINPTVTALADGGFIAGWEMSTGRLALNHDIRGRIFNADGSPRSVNGSTNDFLMSTGPAGSPGNVHPTSATLSNGQVAMGWLFTDTEQVRVRLFNPDGTPVSVNGSTSAFAVGSFGPLSSTTKVFLSITALHTGGFVVAWDGYNGTDYDIFTRLVLPNGSMPDGAQLIGHTANDQVVPQVLELADGHIAVSYQTGDSGDGSGTSIRTALLAFNQPPIATGTATLAPILENSGARLITQAELLSNASDPDGNALQATGLAIASGLGKLVDNHDGTWSYTPAKDDHSAVSFSYQVTDGFVSVADSASLDITPGTVHWAASNDVGPHPAGWAPAGIGDFNTDGTSDLAWYNASSGDLDLWMLQNGGWAGSSDLGSHPAGWQPFAFADFNHDGSSDAAWYNPTTNDVEIWKIQNGHWAGSVDIGAHPAGWQPFGTGDFNGDGTSDLLWYNPTTNDVEVWKIQNGQWAGGSDIGAHPLPWRPIATGDFDGNGTTDLLWYNSATNHAEIWRILNGQWSASVDLGAHPAGWQPIGTGDFNKDGISDIVWYNPTTNDIDVWLINFSQWAGSVDVGAHPAGSVPVGIGDFDHNGVSDIMWRDTTTGHIETWLLAFS